MDFRAQPDGGLPPAPIICHKDHQAPSVFRPENLLREARRQRAVATGRIPDFCVLDPDGDIVRFLRASGQAHPSPHWSCYHTEMVEFERKGRRIGMVGCAVGAPFAVLVAEQMFVAGCRLLVSITSSGQLAPLASAPYFVLVDRAVRDEGTSYHYLPSEAFAEADGRLIDRAHAVLSTVPGQRVLRGATWTTDAPFRETERVLAAGRALGLAAIEMECAALYALARARGFPIVCLAHVTNAMGTDEGDFEKGEDGGAKDALNLIAALAAADIWQPADACRQPVP